VTIAYLPPAAQRSEPTYTCLTSHKLTGRHDTNKLHYTDQEVHTTSPSALVVDFKENYSLSDFRGWQEVAVDCCPPRDM